MSNGNAQPRLQRRISNHSRSSRAVATSLVFGLENAAENVDFSFRLPNDDCSSRGEACAIRRHV